jgi:hypothetical protein
MNPIGFKANQERTNSDIDNSVDNIMRNLSRETVAVQEFDRRLIKELKNVKDMENNLKAITLQIDSMQKLLKTREEIFRRLVDERNKGTKMDVSKTRELLEHINQINGQLRASLGLANTELSKLYIEEKDLMYLESESNRAIMDNISGRAKKLTTEIVIISKYHTALDETINQIYNEVQRIAAERDRRPK